MLLMLSLEVTDCRANSCSVLPSRTCELQGYVRIGMDSSVCLPCPRRARRAGAGARKLSPSVLANRLRCLRLSPFRRVLLCFGVRK